MTVFLPIKPTSLQFSVSSNSYTVMCSDPMIILIEHTDQFLPLKGLQHSWVLLFWMPSKTIFSIFPEIQFVLLRMSQYNTKFSGTKRTKTKAFSFSFCNFKRTVCLIYWISPFLYCKRWYFKTLFWDWRCGSMVQNTDCSLRRGRCGNQHTGQSQPHITPVTGSEALF